MRYPRPCAPWVPVSTSKNKKMHSKNNVPHFRVQVGGDHSSILLTISSLDPAIIKFRNHSLNPISKPYPIARALLLKLTPLALRNSNLSLIDSKTGIYRSLGLDNVNYI